MKKEPTQTAKNDVSRVNKFEFYVTMNLRIIG